MTTEAQREMSPESWRAFRAQAVEALNKIPDAESSTSEEG